MNWLFSLFPAQIYIKLKAIHIATLHGLMRKCMIIIRTNLKYETMHKVPVSSKFYIHFSLFHSPVILSAVDKVKK